MRIFFALVFLALCGGSSAQDLDKLAADTLLIGQWKLANPADAKMLKTAGEPFLREGVYFGHRGKYSVPGGQTEWTWYIREERLTILDPEMEEAMEYGIEKLDQDELILIWSSSGYKLKYTRVKKQ